MLEVSKDCIAVAARRNGGRWDLRGGRV